MNAILKMTQAVAPTRRLVLGGAMIGGALVIGLKPRAAAAADVAAFGPFIRIASDGAVTVVAKHIEFGQGSHNGLAAIVAEEMDADWTQVSIIDAPADAKVYANGLLGVQGTGGSSAIANSWDQLRKAGAGARAMFVDAAARRWSVAAADITVKDGVVAHAKSSRSATFAELLEDAAKVTPPADPKLKDPRRYELVGQPRLRRKDSQAKTDGSARFTQDVRLPGMLTAMVAHPPKFGATVTSFDAAETRKVSGVVAVHQIPSGVAVVARDTWSAFQGREALKVVWDFSKAETRSSAKILADFKAHAAGGEPPAGVPWQEVESRGDPAAADAPGAFEATYDFPYLSHAPMEPMNCVAQVDAKRVKLTFGCQIPTLDQINAATVVGGVPGDVEIETLFAGGSFGRRATFASDFVVECVQIAKALGANTPVKLVWTRADDMHAGYYRPLTHHRLRIVTDKQGYPTAWRHRIVTQSILKGTPMGGKGPDQTAVEGVMGSPYLKATPAVDAELMTPDVGVPVLWWRSVGATHTAFVMEHTIDQLARRAGKDPVEYRRALYKKAGATRAIAVLDLAAEKAGWGKPAPAGWACGVAVHESFGSIVAQVAWVTLKDGQPKVGRVVTAIDCGTAVAPDQIAAQMEGGTCYGLSAALYGEITLKDGEVEQNNFDGYRVLRNSEAPQVETYIVPSAAPPSGAGEPGTPVIGPAVANALLALTGKPTLSQPMVKG